MEYRGKAVLLPYGVYLDNNKIAIMDAVRSLLGLYSRIPIGSKICIKHGINVAAVEFTLEEP